MWQEIFAVSNFAISPAIRKNKFPQIMAQSNPSVPIPPGICHFVLEKLQMPHGRAGRSYKNPTVGLKNRVQMPHLGTTPKLYFPVNKLQIPNLWEISNNLIKTLEAPYANRP